MKNIFLALIALALVSPALAGDFPKGSPAFLHSYKDALAVAKSNGKPVILVFSASWCPPCQTMKKEVYPNSRIRKFHDRFVWAYLDLDETSNEAVVEKFKVGPIPHIQFLDAQGKAIGNIGASEVDEFSKALASVIRQTSK